MLSSKGKDRGTMLSSKGKDRGTMLSSKGKDRGTMLSPKGKDGVTMLYMQSAKPAANQLCLWEEIPSVTLQQGTQGL